jgi:acylphosphatase
MARIRRRVRAHGKVQGVFFRDSTRAEAERREVKGWVKNRDDGSVEAVFEGEPDMVEHMVWFVRNGPGSSDVSRVDVDEEEPEDLRGFKVT